MTGLAAGVAHGGACAYNRHGALTAEAVPTVMTHAVGGVIAVQYFPLTVPYYLYRGGGACPQLQKWLGGPAEEKLT